MTGYFSSRFEDAATYLDHDSYVEFVSGDSVPLELSDGPKLWEAESGEVVTLHGIFHLGACGPFPHDFGCIEVKDVIPSHLKVSGGRTRSKGERLLSPPRTGSGVW